MKSNWLRWMFFESDQMFTRCSVVFYLVCRNNKSFSVIYLSNASNISTRLGRNSYSLFFFNSSKTKSTVGLIPFILAYVRISPKLGRYSNQAGINFIIVWTSALNPSLFRIPVFRFNTVSSRDERTLSSIVVISNIEDSSPLSSDVLWFNIWSIFCDSKSVLLSYCKITKAIRYEQYLIVKS